MRTEFEILRLVEDDLLAVAKREQRLGPPGSGRRRVGWGRVVAACLAVLVVASAVGWLAQGGARRLAIFRTSEDAGSAAATGATGAGGETGGDLSGDELQAQPTPAPGVDQSLDYWGASDDLAAVGGAGAAQQDLSKIVRNGAIAIRVGDGDFSAGFAAVTRIARNNGGFVLTSTTTGQRAGTFTLRVPASRFDEAMLSLRRLGVVERQRIAGKDVTAQFIDLNARLDILRQRKALLLDLQADATTSSEILRLATLVQRTQLDIERIQGELNFLNDQVSESTIDVSLHEETSSNPDGQDVDPDLGDAWDDAIDGFYSVLAAVVVGLGYLIPIGVIALAILGVTAWVRRRRAAS